MNVNHTSKTIIGAIAGDIIGSIYEWENYKSTDFPLFSPTSRFTDDSVLTMAVADCILNQKPFRETLAAYGREYADVGFGKVFKVWMQSPDLLPYGSIGNGSAMRISPVGFAYSTLEETLAVAEQSASVSHNSIEGIKGAKAVAAAIFLARTGKSKAEIKQYIETTFEYNLDESLDDIRPNYTFDYTCAGSIPQSIRAFLESTDYENAIRLAISIGGDSDTIACIAGGIAAAFYKHIPDKIIEQVVKRLPKEYVAILEQFETRFNN
jgi:ADP-ribosylglycohydrolase